ncbi:GTP 3',8-cyclase MoaA [Clostridium tagluense]|uniref:GTP 3',8-cyclase MoaA n=1 Tax=Clostridium tagluense TaxID=360422 RepID=UPI001C0DA5C2|nr:GTP 3',8-cyclase MoaA [Clostridium tagluense]MBU3128305.1 GTP 3',8-cyclase MoaA [Clostridium tagluense]MCB2310790.1 GTP 3',8-cyclase MoaA [Clostridium tagluense]MCB2315480.1 GTP 3',8-cyclase MoaA [Clostridium tagluense]MCB2320333.1 GTP 3',8-cyclase MoaA [Clostridium tagluense]MCB2325383.1 GTP 3',8-cyclase MoaA [Clostridium tagluense]
MRDTYGRNINYLRVSVTDRCNLRCVYCMPEEGIKSLKHEDILRFEDTLKIVRAATALGINKIRYTGGEPLVMKDIDKLIYETSKIPGINDIAITTNGILLSDMAGDLKKAGLKRVNISLDTLNSEKYKSITRVGNLDKVMESIDKCLSLGLKPVKINTVLMRGINDVEFENFLNLTRELPVEIRFIELMPIGEGIKMYEKNNLSFMEMLGLHPELTKIGTEKSSTAELYKLTGAKGRIGFISPVSCKFCGDCNKIRLTSTGTIKPCLHSKEEINLRKYLNNEEMLTNAIKSAIESKPLEHHLREESASRSVKGMSQIGG